MSEYRRPTIPVGSYRDEQGLPIDYGNCWGRESPPEDAYARVSNLERFAPLHDVALALVEWLRSTFDVDVEKSSSAAADLLLQPRDLVQAVRIVPREHAAAPLTFVLSRFPGVFLHAGSLHDFHFPACGCDACDDNVTELIAQLEWTVRTVVSGGYSETLAPGSGDWIEYRLDDFGVGMQAGRTSTQELPNERVVAARTAIPASGQWNSWPLRSQHDANAFP